MNQHDIMKYFGKVNEKLKLQGHHGEIVMAGGAVMLLVVKNREATKDVDAYFVPSEHIRNAALAVAKEESLPDDWLNDGVKGFFYGTPPQEHFADFSNLSIFNVSPKYMIAMKAVAGRDEDIEDLKALIQFTGLKNTDEVLDIVQQYVPSNLLKPQVQYSIQDIFDEFSALKKEQIDFMVSNSEKSVTSSQGTVRCRVCNRPLRSESSIKRGVGRECAKRESTGKSITST